MYISPSCQLQFRPLNSELSVLLDSSLGFSGNVGGGWSLEGDVGTLEYGGGDLDDISVSLRL